MHGRDYFFVTDEEFQQAIAEGKFLEYARNNGNLYGTPIAGINECLSKGDIVITDIDVKGVALLKQDSVALRNSKLVTFFCMPPGRTLEEKIVELRHRAIERGKENPDQIEEGLRWAEHEMAQANTYDHILLMERGRAEEIVEHEVLPVIDKVRSLSREVYAV